MAHDEDENEASLIESRALEWTVAGERVVANKNVQFSLLKLVLQACTAYRHLRTQMWPPGKEHECETVGARSWRLLPKKEAHGVEPSPCTTRWRSGRIWTQKYRILFWSQYFMKEFTRRYRLYAVAYEHKFTINFDKVYYLMNNSQVIFVNIISYFIWSKKYVLSWTQKFNIVSEV